MSKTVNVDGIDIEVAFDPNDDYELFEQTLVINDPETPPAEASRAIAKRNRLVLGNKYGEVLSHIREKNGGRLPVADVNGFVSKVFSKAEELKN